MKKLLLLLLLPILTFAQDSWINIQFDFDGYADEVTWNLYNSTGDTIASGGDYINGQLDAFHQISLDSGEYTFELTVSDDYGSETTLTRTVVIEPEPNMPPVIDMKIRQGSELN